MNSFKYLSSLLCYCLGCFVNFTVLYTYILYTYRVISVDQILKNNEFKNIYKSLYINLCSLLDDIVLPTFHKKILQHVYMHMVVPTTHRVISVDQIWKNNESKNIYKSLYNNLCSLLDDIVPPTFHKKILQHVYMHMVERFQPPNPNPSR